MKIYNNNQLLSNKKTNIFDTFGEALAYAIDRRGIKHTSIAEKADKMDYGQLSKYLSGKRTPRPPNQKLLTKVVGVQIEETDNEKWRLIDPLDDIPVEEKIREYKSRKDLGDFSDTERALLLQLLLEKAESLSRVLRHLIEIEKTNGHDDS